MTWIWDAPYFGPLCGLAGSALAIGGKLWLERRAARREEAEREHESEGRALDVAAHGQLERAAERDHEIVTRLLGGLDGVREEFAELRRDLVSAQTENHTATLKWIAEERRISDERVDKSQAKFERLADKAVTVIGEVRNRAEPKERT